MQSLNLRKYLLVQLLVRWASTDSFITIQVATLSTLNHKKKKTKRSKRTRRKRKKKTMEHTMQIGKTREMKQKCGR